MPPLGDIGTSWSWSTTLLGTPKRFHSDRYTLLPSLRLCIKVWTRVGIPDVIHTDQGTQFVFDLMKQIHHLLGVRGETSSPYHAQSNGLVERFNATLKQMPRRLCQEKPKDW
eukprot:TRINITY_DN57718_c0_g2_i3.p1 TRINITY_DN57718_c0_g2~~TRINITY_DN57718_c0_g2_i3.p1  ORF type:complete len:112 (+),score=3.30 TRINITY_DN57718_c0_g2_i3:180-515(+)